MSEMANYALPVYQAVVSGLALKVLQEQEDAQSNECKSLQQAEELLSKFDELLAKFSAGDFAEAKRDDIRFIATGLALLVSVSRAVVKSGLDQVKEIPESHQAAFRAKLSGIEADADRTEELAESWYMGLDEEFVPFIKKSVEESQLIDPEGIPDWRDVLAKLQD